MILKQLKPRKALNKAYLKLKPERENIDTFKANLIQLLDRIDDSESEEFHKNLISDFLKDTYYKDNHFINTKERADLVIHNGKNRASTVGVIIETKRPSNKWEMITPEELNAKAFHELLLYYLRERITNGNLEIRNLIVTNIHEWFIFDSALFERNFAQNKALIRQFEAFEKSKQRTEVFYTEIAHPFIESLKNEIEFAYFDIRDYNKPLRNDNPDDDNKLIALYKLLSAEHLLKLPFANDSNTLDKSFYGELLHIMGLSESKEGGKKVIGREADGKRNIGSLIENAINELDSLDKMSRLERPSQYGDTMQDRLFNVALELTITWMNRILFMKLLEAQLIKYHKGNAQYEFLNTHKIQNYDDLNSLFFKVLARQLQDRGVTTKEAFDKVPYLNSSLFEPTELEHTTLFVSNLGDSRQLPIYSATVLKDSKGKRRTGKMPPLQYLFEFLDSYDFTSEGAEAIQEDNKTLINASVLGLIFEKINGYKDGSFFTPGFITMYMCRETIRKAVLQKFNETKGWKCRDFDDLYNEIDNRKEANTIINSIKICDPAVGSGHFLVSALNEIIAIKNDLRILSDRDDRRLKEYHVVVENDELIVTDEEGAIFEYNPTSRESQRVQEALFHEKQTIIESCLFGVDINPNSVKICRLRLWIELLKNAYYKNETELETLPNIDINIKCGNSLVSRFQLDANLGQALKKSKWTIDSYRLAVATYRNAHNKEEKREMERLMASIKNDFRSEIAGNDPKVKRLAKIKGELLFLTTQTSLFEQSRKEKKEWNDKVNKLTKEIKKLETEIEEIKANKIYENAFEWRFEFPEVLNDEGDFVGFDVVIGNPPYIYNRDLDKKQRDFLKNKYNAADDLYVYFTYEGLSILNNNGHISLITPNTYFTLSSRTHFRESLLQYSNLIFTYSGFCFEDAYVETMIFELSKQKNKESKISFIPEPNDYLSFDTYLIDANEIRINIFHRFYIPTKTNVSLNSKINKNLLEVSTKYSDILFGKSSTQLIKDYNSSLKEGDITLLGLISDGEQGLVTGNNSRYIGNIIDSEKDGKNIDEKFIDMFNIHNNEIIDVGDFNINRESIYEQADLLKKKKGKLGLFGKFFLYKNIRRENVESFSILPESIKENGGSEDLWINYNRGNSEGYKWYIPYSECINWSEKFVKELKEGVVTNSRWQGAKYYNVTGFGWVDYFTNKIKAFFVEKGVYSKNIVKLHSVNKLISDKYIVGLLNSKFISYYIKNFITSTHTLQINDGRLIPVYVPSNEEHSSINMIVDKILEAKKQSPTADTTSLESEIDQLVYELYGLTEEEIAIVEGA